MSRSSWNASPRRGPAPTGVAGSSRPAGARSIACPRCGAAAGASCQLTSGTARPDHPERVSLARGQRSVAVGHAPNGVSGGQPLRVVVEDLDGNIVRSVDVTWQEAERTKGRLITQMHEAGRRDVVAVRIVDAHGATW